MKRILIAGVSVVLAGCVTSDDPSKGGFYNGIAGVSNGTYDKRVAEREAEVRVAEAENARLTGQLAALRGEHSRAKNAVIQARARARAAGVALSAQQESQVAGALRANPDKIASLQKAIADARRLADSLTKLAG